MSQETHTPVQPAQSIDGEKKLALQGFRAKIDPFQESLDGEIARARGLTNLYLQMADPSLEYVETVSHGLLELSFGQLRELKFDTYEALYDGLSYFTRNGVDADYTDKLKAGISHSSELINRVADEFSEETEELYSEQPIDVRALAESIHERIQVENGRRALSKAAATVKAEPDLEIRSQMGLDLKEQVLGYTHGFRFTFIRSYGERNVEPTWDNLSKIPGLSVEFTTKGGGSISGFFGIEEAVDTAEAAISRYSFEQRLEQLPKRDKERFEELRLQYGAKASNLLLLSEMVDDINALRSDISISVPDFKLLSVDLYEAWKEGELTDDLLLPYFQWARTLEDENRWLSDGPTYADYMVRSSAVFSEDGEEVTGAGVYESVRVHSGASFEEFKSAVARVYASTDSSQARAYREEHGIPEEKMGIVIQKYVSDMNFGYTRQSGAGYINSKLTGVPQLMEVVTQSSRNFIKREELDFLLAMDAEWERQIFHDTHHFPPDTYKVRPELPIKVAQLTAVVERIWGNDIQVEFISEGSKINFVQVRDLPQAAVGEEEEIRFPEEQADFTGASIGVGDRELQVLPSTGDNSKKTGVVIFLANHMWTVDGKFLALPKDGAVIITSNEGRNGHIQTLAAEKGLLCVFPDDSKDEYNQLPHSKLLFMGSMRIVSNGMEARIYKRDDDTGNEEEIFDSDFNATEELL